MTWHAALEGLSDGCIAAFLQSSTMDEPVYQRMGFQHCVRYREWEPQQIT